MWEDSSLTWLFYLCVLPYSEMVFRPKIFAIFMNWGLFLNNKLGIYNQIGKRLLLCVGRARSSQPAQHSLVSYKEYLCVYFQELESMLDPGALLCETAKYGLFCGVMVWQLTRQKNPNIIISPNCTS